MLVVVLAFGTSQSSDFLSGTTLFNLGYNTGYIAIMAMPMTLIIMTGEIDLSVASMLGLSGSMVGFLWHHGWGLWHRPSSSRCSSVSPAARSTACSSCGSGCRPSR